MSKPKTYSSAEELINDGPETIRVIVAGGPGVGKSTVVMEILSALGKAGLSFMAPAAALPPVEEHLIAMHQQDRLDAIRRKVIISIEEQPLRRDLSFRRNPV